MVGSDASRSIQVLNISNVNAEGKTVLNDGKLLELIQLYPFLYNARVRSYGDPDYCLWAWKRINAAFNRSYENDPFAAFSIYDLSQRWMVLKPLIQCLSKAYDLAAIPETLRHSVMKICTELDDPSTNCSQKPISLAQSLLQQNMSAIEQLPKETRLALEKDVLDLIFSTEIESRVLKKLDVSEITQANQDAEDFLNDIAFNKVLLNAINEQTNMTNNYKVDSSLSYNTKYPNITKYCPLNEASKYTRPCCVRVKRMNLEDYLPLSKIKSMTKKKAE